MSPFTMGPMFCAAAAARQGKGGGRAGVCTEEERGRTLITGEFLWICAYAVGLYWR